MWQAICFHVPLVVAAIRRQDETLDSAPAHSNAKSAEPVDEVYYLIEFFILEVKAEQAGIPGERPAVIRKCRMKNFGHLGPRSQELGNLQSIVVMLLHSNRHRAQSTQQQPGIEGMENSAEQHVCAIEDLLHAFVGCNDCARDDIAVTADVLCCRVNDDVDAVKDGLLEER